MLSHSEPLEYVAQLSLTDSTVNSSLTSHFNFKMHGELQRYFSNRAAFKSIAADKYHLKSTDIDEAVQANPNLVGVSEDLWKRVHHTFSSHGLPTNNFLRMVITNPSLLSQKPQQISKNFEKWRGCQFGEKNVHLFLTKYPEMLNIDDTKNMHTHITFLRRLLLNQSNVWKALMNSPDIMQQSEGTLKEKIDYFTEKMGLEMPEIVKSAALSKTLEEIKVRHTFQVRLGLFKPQKKDADVLEPSTNCRLYKITDTSEKAFATKICHATLDEFYAFKELFLREMNTTTEYDSEDSDDG